LDVIPWAFSEQTNLLRAKTPAMRRQERGETSRGFARLLLDRSSRIKPVKTQASTERHFFSKDDQRPFNPV